MVMPLWDENPFNKPVKPWVTWGLIAINIVVFLIEVGVGDEGLAPMIKQFAVTPIALTHPDSLFSMIPSDLTLVTYVFLHGGWLHIISNMIFLFVFGDDIEEAMGPFRFIIFYLACGIVGGLVFAASAPLSSVPLVGASGAVAGILVAYLMLRPCAKIRVLAFFIIPLTFRLSAFWVIGLFVVIQLFQIAAKSDDDVAYWCHIGGLLAGAVLFPLMRNHGVRLFECIEHPDEPKQEGPLGGPTTPNITTISGTPREPTVR
jgi:membrane associated rhomboid family serine protease